MMQDKDNWRYSVQASVALSSKWFLKRVLLVNKKPTAMVEFLATDGKWRGPLDKESPMFYLSSKSVAAETLTKILAYESHKELEGATGE